MDKQTDETLFHWREAVPNDRLAHLVRDVSRVFSRALQDRLAEVSIPFGHWTFLRVLWVRDGITQKDLSYRAGVMEPTTFVALKAMESLGYIERRQHPDNQKNVYVYLTPRGRALEKKLVPLAEQLNAVATKGILKADLATTRTTLLQILENMAAAQQPEELARVQRKPRKRA